MASRAGAWVQTFVLFGILYAGIPWTGIQIDRLLRLPPWPAPVSWVGLTLVAVGVSVLGWCLVLFARVGNGTPNPTRPPETLVAVGPYAWTRNPIALAHAAALFGLSAFLGSPSAVGIVLLLAYPIHLAMLHEERTLDRRFGHAYRVYRDSVPRWIPRRPRRQS